MFMVRALSGEKMSQFCPIMNVWPAAGLYVMYAKRSAHARSLNRRRVRERVVDEVHLDAAGDGIAIVDLETEARLLQLKGERSLREVRIGDGMRCSRGRDHHGLAEGLDCLADDDLGLDDAVDLHERRLGRLGLRLFHWGRGWFWLRLWIRGFFRRLCGRIDRFFTGPGVASAGCLCGCVALCFGSFLGAGFSRARRIEIDDDRVRRQWEG